MVRKKSANVAIRENNEIMDINTITGFEKLGLSKNLLKTIEEAGYLTPTPIQAQVIPTFLTGKDVVGLAQTGTGKTAAFALPILEQIDLTNYEPQILVLTPTRELANQVCESFKTYGNHLEGLRTVAVYGGLEYGSQLRAFLRGVHIVVGTPGRIMDHIKRGTLSLGSLKTLVLDEADEMLNMGFKEDVEWILEHAPQKRQMALFSATMPEDIRSIARKFMNEPVEITIRQRTATVENTRQRYWQITGLQKIDALSRLLEAETYDAVLIFVSKKIDTLEVTDQLNLRGFNVSALNGDLPQSQRERIIDQLKNGKLDIVVATDIAARGLDVDRISHVINYDLPPDQESYIHRIGRTGRAGRKGEAIIFISARERRWLSMLEKTTRQPIEQMQMPTASFICDKRIERFKASLTATLEGSNLEFYRNLIDRYCHETSAEPLMVASALAKLLTKNNPLQISEQKNAEAKALQEFVSSINPKADRRSRRDIEPEEGMISYRVEVGKFHGVQPANLVGAIAGETGMSSRYIGRIRIMDTFSIVDLPEDTPQELIQKLENVVVCRRVLHITPDRSNGPLAEKKPKINIADIDPDDLAANPELAKMLGIGTESEKPKIDASKMLFDFRKAEKEAITVAKQMKKSSKQAFEKNEELNFGKKTDNSSKNSKKDKNKKEAKSQKNFDGKKQEKQSASKQKALSNKAFIKPSKNKIPAKGKPNRQERPMTKSESRKFRKRR